MARLNTFIHVQDDHGQMHVFGPDDATDVPDWAVEKITAPGVWVDEPALPAAAPHRRAAAPAATPASPAAASPAEDVTDGQVQEPPRSGAGSGKDAWATYARTQGVDVTDDMSRDEIVAAVERARGDQAAE